MDYGCLDLVPNEGILHASAHSDISDKKCISFFVTRPFSVPTQQCPDAQRNSFHQNFDWSAQRPDLN